MMHWWRLGLGLIGLVGCVNRQPGPVTTETPAEVAIMVESNNSATIVVYLEARGNSRRLGEIHTKETLSWVFAYREFGTGYTRLRGEVIGSDERVYTPDLKIQPGEVVRWSLAPRLVQSSVTQF